MQASDAPYWDPYDARLSADPWKAFQRIREEAPLYRNDEHDFYMVTRMTDVERVLTDWRRSLPPAETSSS